MLKKSHKMKGGGRKQILQLDDKKQPKYLQLYSSSREACPLDTEVADFFKEINSLETVENSNNFTESPLIPDSREEESASLNSKIDSENDLKETESTKESEAIIIDGCPWKKIRDDSTGYAYYWNINTNDVTWDCPDGYISDSVTENNIKDGKECSKNKFKEGSAIPISYFEDSTSSEDESANESLPKKQKLTRRENIRKSDQNSGKLKKHEVMGPQLPSDFQFPPTDDEKLKSICDEAVSPCENSKVANEESSIIPANKLIVEYDSFTDDEEEKEAVSSNVYVDKVSSSELLSSSKTNSKNNEATETLKSLLDRDGLTNEKEALENKTSIFNIDNIFAASIKNEKHGFGFIQDSNSKSDFKSKSKIIDYKASYFVKSDDVFDLNATNTVSQPEELNEKVLDRLDDDDQNIDEIEDIDEIDKALCEALEAKKAAACTVQKEPDISLESTEKIESVNWKMKPNPEVDKDTITDLSSTLIDKLSFLMSNHSLISLSNLLVQLQTRFLDWQASALDSKYFLDRLEEVKQYMNQYESEIVTGDWICEWDKDNKRYYYLNRKTQHSQWTFPNELFSVESSTSVDVLPPQPAEDPPKCETPPPPPPGVDSPPPPSPPPAPPSPCDLSEDMDIENSPDSTTSNNQQSPMIISDNNLNIDAPVKMFEPVENSLSVHSCEPQPSCYSDSIPRATYCESPKLVSNIPSKELQSLSKTQGTMFKKERKKTKLLKKLTLKKKNMPSLVEKWQKIREEQEKDDDLDHS